MSRKLKQDAKAKTFLSVVPEEFYFHGCVDDEIRSSYNMQPLRLKTGVSHVTLMGGSVSTDVPPLNTTAVVGQHVVISATVVKQPSGSLTEHTGSRKSSAGGPGGLQGKSTGSSSQTNAL